MLSNVNQPQNDSEQTLIACYPVLTNLKMIVSKPLYVLQSFFFKF